MGRIGLTLVLFLLVQLCSVQLAPVPGILTHKNIVMTLHGLIDHVDVGRLEVGHDNFAMSRGNRDTFWIG
jgi:hypothetical protein